MLASTPANTTGRALPHLASQPSEALLLLVTGEERGCLRMTRGLPRGGRRGRKQKWGGGGGRGGRGERGGGGGGGGESPLEGSWGGGAEKGRNSTITVVLSSLLPGVE